MKFVSKTCLEDYEVEVKSFRRILKLGVYFVIRKKKAKKASISSFPVQIILSRNDRIKIEEEKI